MRPISVRLWWRASLGKPRGRTTLSCRQSWPSIRDGKGESLWSRRHQRPDMISDLVDQTETHILSGLCVDDTSGRPWANAWQDVVLDQEKQSPSPGGHAALVCETPSYVGVVMSASLYASRARGHCHRSIDTCTTLHRDTHAFSGCFL